MNEYEISYTIRRDGQEIGFGAATWSSIAAALHAIGSDIQNRMWETEPGMPDPKQVETDV